MIKILRCARFLLVFAVIACVVHNLHAQLLQKTKSKISYESDRAAAIPAGQRFELPADVFLLAEYTFDSGPSCTTDGWTSVDNTAQRGTYFHISDFATPPDNCGPGGFGGLVPLSGSQSLWCGICPNATDSVLCGYAVLPGYGNYWDQMFESTNFPTTGDVRVDFLIRYDSEASYDSTIVEYLASSGTWRILLEFDGKGEGPASALIDSDSLDGNTKLRFRFTSDGGGSDEDGLWGFDGDGAVIIDSLTIADATGVVDFQDFELEAAGAITTMDGDWTATVPTPYGDYAALYHGPMGLDPSNVNTTCFWGFLDGSPADYSCGGYPATVAVPYEAWRPESYVSRNRFIQNEIQSPVVPFGGSGDQVYLQFDVYQDLPIDPLVFYTWSVRFLGAGCWTPWLSDGFFHYGDQQEWISKQFEVGSLSPLPLSLVTHMQVALGVTDMCWAWCGALGTGLCHSNAPLFDNVRIRRANIPPVARTEEQSVFQTSDNKTVSSSAFIKLLNDSLDAVYQDLELVMLCCHSGEFVTRAQNAPDGLGGSSSVSTACDKDHDATDFRTTGDIDIPQGPGKDIAGLHYRNRYYHGYSAQYVKKLMEDKNTIGNKALHEAAAAKIHHPVENPCYGSSGTLADTTTVHGGKKSNHAILYAQPATFGGELDDALYDALIGAGYTADEINYLKNSAKGVGNVDENATLADLKKAIGALRDSLDLNPHEEKAYIVISAHGGYESRTIATQSGGFSRIAPGAAAVFDGEVLSYPEDSVYVHIDSTLMFSLMEDLPDSNGIPFVDDPSTSRATDSPYLSFATVYEVFFGAPDVDLYLDDVFLSTVPMIGGGLAGEYQLSIPDSVLSEIMYGVFLDSTITVKFAFQTPGDSVRLATDSDFYGSSYPFDTYGVGIGAVFACSEELSPDPTGIRPNDMPDEYSLAQNHPNPFNPVTTIWFSLPEPGYVTLGIYDVLGRRVAVLTSKRYAAGRHFVEWEPEGVASGVYFYRIQVNDFVSTKKLVVLK